MRRFLLARQCGCVDDSRLWAIRELIRQSNRPSRLRHRYAFLSQLLFVGSSPLGELSLADFDFLFKIGFSESPAQSPFLQSYAPASRSRDRLADKMDRTQASHQDQGRCINSNQENKRTERTKRAAEETVTLIGEGVSDPAARSLDIEGGMPAAQMVRLQMQ